MQESDKGPNIRSLPEIIKKGADDLEETANTLENLGLQKLAELTNDAALELYEEAKKALKPPTGQDED